MCCHPQCKNRKRDSHYRYLVSSLKEQGHPIAIEPFGAVTQIEAFRRNKKEGDLYTLMVSWANLDELRLEDQMFIVGNLIRGGVFSRASK